MGAVSDVTVKSAFQSTFSDTGDTSRYGPTAHNASRLFTGGNAGEVCVRDSTSATGASWLPPTFVNTALYGVVGDGTADDTAPIVAAIAAATAAGGGLVVLPPGTFKTTAFTVPVNVILRGGGPATILKPSSSVTTYLTLAAGATLEHLYIDGVNTTGCVGVSLGVSVIADHVVLRGVTITRFVGTNAIGMSLGLVVTFAAYDCYLFANEYNLITGGAATPTNSLFVNCQFRTAVKQGVWIKTGYSSLFLSCLFESNQEEGLYIAATGGLDILDVRVWECWFENNWLSIASGAGRHAKYDCTVDGSAAGTIRPEFRSCYFSGGPTAAKSLHFITTIDYLLDHVKVFNEAANILIDVNSYGTIVNWPVQNGVLNTTVSNLGSLIGLPAGAGGTGQSVYAVGDLLYADTTTTLARRAGVVAGRPLISGGVNTAPAYASGASAVTIPATAGGAGLNINGRNNAGVDEGYLQFFKNDGTTFQGSVYGKSAQVAITGPAGADVLTVTDPGVVVTGTLKATTAFGCNSKAAQTAFASGGALNAYGAGLNGFDTGANASALHAMVVAIRAALVANGIMS